MRRLFAKPAVVLALVISLAALSVTPIAAQQYGQYGQYGGNTPSTQLSITKTVKDPVTGTFIKDITQNGNLFGPGSQVVFQITVKNNGQTSFGFVDVKDTLPNYLTFVSGNGNYTSQTREFTYRIANLTPGASDTRDITTTVVATGQLPTTSGIICTVNNVSATANTGQTASDTSQACIGQKPGPVSALPSTGPLLTSALIFVVIGAVAAAGFMLRKAKH